MIDGLFELLRSDGSIVVNKKLAHKIGLNESILYSELISRYIYFKNKNQLTKDGFFYNTVEDLKKGTTLGKSPQLKAIKNLEKLKLMFVTLRGLPAIRHFKPNLDTNVILNLLKDDEQCEARQLLVDEPRKKTINVNKIITDKEVKVNKVKKDSNFEKLWVLYPSKKGKTHVSKDKKEEINNYENLEELINYLEQYKQDKNLIINGGWKNPKNGSTFFNNLIAEVEKQKGINDAVAEKTNAKIVEVKISKIKDQNKDPEQKQILF